MVNAAYARVRDDIVRLVHRGLPVPEFAQAVGSALLRAVPAEGTCLMTLDPATMLPTAEYVENGLPAAELLRLVEIEVREPDFNKWTQLARADHPAASLSAVTAGDLDRSLRQREIRRPGGFADELRAVLGSWGALTVFRETQRPALLARRRAVRVVDRPDWSPTGCGAGCSSTPRAAMTDVGLLVLDADDEVTPANPAAQRWLDDLGTSDREGARLPLVVPAVARQAPGPRSRPWPGRGRAPGPGGG